MIYDLPTAVNIHEVSCKIRNECDYRVILDCIDALNDVDLTQDDQIKCALFIFYKNVLEIPDYEIAVQEMFKIISGEELGMHSNSNIRLMDWQFDFQRIAAPVNRILGYDCRVSQQYTHWYTFLSAYSEIGDCQFSTIIQIRSKMAKGKPLDKVERQYLQEHREIIVLPKKLTSEEQQLLDEKW